MKNIPIPTKQNFLTQLIRSSGKIVDNMRWKAFFFLNPSEQREKKETFGFNATKPSPTHIKELKEFRKLNV